MRVGILGGTFNPVHNGHLFLAEEALHLMGLQKVLFVPNRRPPHKNLPDVDPEARYEMLVAATEQVPEFEVSRVELDRDGRSYTVDTLDALKGEHELVFICGADAFDAPWHRLKDVFDKLAGVVLANRAGHDHVLPTQLQALSEQQQKKVTMMPFPDISISSSEIRRRVNQGKPYRFLIPEPVFRIITSSRFYFGDSES